MARGVEIGGSTTRRRRPPSTGTIQSVRRGGQGPVMHGDLVRRHPDEGTVPSFAGSPAAPRGRHCRRRPRRRSGRSRPPATRTRQPFRPATSRRRSRRLRCSCSQRWNASTRCTSPDPDDEQVWAVAAPAVDASSSVRARTTRLRMLTNTCRRRGRGPQALSGATPAGCGPRARRAPRARAELDPVEHVLEEAADDQPLCLGTERPRAIR